MEELDIGLEASSSRMSIARRKKDKCKCKPQLKEKHGQGTASSPPLSQTSIVLRMRERESV
jgi:hypothetical protein